MEGLTDDTEEENFTTIYDAIWLFVGRVGSDCHYASGCHCGNRHIVGLAAAPQSPCDTSHLCGCPLTAVLVALVATFMMLPTLLTSDDDADDGVAETLMIIWGMVGLIAALAGLNYWWFRRFIPFTTANLSESLGTGGSIIRQKSSWIMKPVVLVDVGVVVASHRARFPALCVDCRRASVGVHRPHGMQTMRRRK